VVVVAASLGVGGASLDPLVDHRPTPSPGGSVRAFASFGGLHVVGKTPRAVSLAWPPSTDLLFNHYEVDDSSSGPSGPWTSVGTLALASDASFFSDGLVPSNTYSWRVLEINTLGLSSTSNVLNETQPFPAHLSANLSGPATARLSWTNGAQYGSTIAFVAYTVLAALGGAPGVPLATITDVSTRTFTAPSLLPGSTYLFTLETTDRCAGASNCAANGPMTESSSSPSSVNTPLPVQATATASSPTIQSGQIENFSCSASGGAPPYTFAWTFGDGATGHGPVTSHVYRSTGSFTAQCAATDLLGSRATSSVTVTVTAPSGGGGGGGGGGSGGGSGNGSGNGSGGGSGHGNGTGNGTGPSHPPPPSGGHSSHVSAILFSPAASWLVAGAVLASVLLLLLFAIPRRRRSKRNRGQDLPPGASPEMPPPPSHLPIAAVAAETAPEPSMPPASPWVPPGVDDRIDFDVLWEQRDLRTPHGARRTGSTPDSSR
jgi:PKD domain-containing protein